MGENGAVLYVAQEVTLAWEGGAFDLENMAVRLVLELFGLADPLVAVAWGSVTVSGQHRLNRFLPPSQW